MKTVWKFKIEHAPHQEIEMPQGAQILTVQTQYNVPHLWALVDPEAPREARTFMIVGTGHVMGNPPPDMRLDHVGSYQQQGGAYVFHLFEVVSVDAAASGVKASA